MNNLKLLLIVFISGTQLLLSQTDSLNTIDHKIITNKEKLQKDPIKAYREIDKLISKAIQLNDADEELRLLAKRYEYDYLLKIDFEQMISSAKILKDRAIVHKNRFYEAISHKYLSQVYTFNGLYNKALDELQSSLEVINKIDPETSKVIMEKANIYTAFTNVYTQNDEPFGGIQYIYKAIEEHEKLTDPELKRGAKLMDYANLGGVYLKVNLDSAKYYADKSITYSKPNEYNHNLMFINYLVIGNVYLRKKDYLRAIEYYKKAEAIKEGKYFMNVKELYENFIKTYDRLGEIELKEQYEHKLKDLSLTVAQSQSKSLRKIIQNDRKNINSILDEQKETNHHWVWVLVLVVGLGMAILTLYKYKGKKESNNALTPEKYNELINLLKDNDQTFLLAFETEFPHFSQNLLKLCPELSNSEIELLAMVKLGLSSKEIAQYKFIQHKTVQNKRHIIRKKLNLSSDIDLDKWIDNLG